jgi:hypothetical protein
MQARDHLIDAADTLETLAQGLQPDPARLLSGALALETLRLSGKADRDCLDAATGLEILATGGTLDLDESGRSRAAHLAVVVRRIADELLG